MSSISCTNLHKHCIFRNCIEKKIQFDDKILFHILNSKYIKYVKNLTRVADNLESPLSVLKWKWEICGHRFLSWRFSDYLRFVIELEIIKVLLSVINWMVLCCHLTDTASLLEYKIINLNTHARMRAHIHILFDVQNVSISLSNLPLFLVAFPLFLCRCLFGYQNLEYISAWFLCLMAYQPSWVVQC